MSSRHSYTVKCSFEDGYEDRVEFQSTEILLTRVETSLRIGEPDDIHNAILRVCTFFTCVVWRSSCSIFQVTNLLPYIGANFPQIPEQKNDPFA